MMYTRIPLADPPAERGANPITLPPSLTRPPRTGEGDSALEQLVEAASQRLERGEPLDVEAFCAAHPEHAAELRELLPAVAMLFHIGAEPVDCKNNGEALPFARLGDFRLIREIGRGGMGTVYEAEQISLHRRVALKVLPFASVLDKQQLARFQNEARAAATLEHPNIVAVHSVGTDRGVHYYAMQLIEGQSLAEVVEEKRKATQRVPGGKREEGSDAFSAPLSAFRSPLLISPLSASGYHCGVAELGIQAARALEHAHKSGVVHRDIKPANLLLDRDGKLWVTDFGLARICSEVGLTMSGDLLGTLRYMSPEQMSSKSGVVDHRTDIYSLGATLYELLAFVPPFDGEDRPELVRQISMEEPRRLQQRDRRIPIDLETIVSKAMDKSAAARYATADELADDLQRFVDHQPIHAKRATYTDRLMKWSRRHHALVAAAGLALLALSAVLVASIGLVNRARFGTAAALDETADLLYVADMGAAYQAWEKGWADEAHEILQRNRPKQGEPDRRGFEWHLLSAAVMQPEMVELAGHEGAVNEIAVFPDGRRLASVGDDGTLRIWDVDSHKLLKTVKVCNRPLHSVAVAHDQFHVLCGSEGPLVNPNQSGDPATVYLCDVWAGYKTDAFFHCEHTIESVAFHPQGRVWAIGSRYHDVFLLAPNGALINRIPCGSKVQSLEFFPRDSALIVPNRVPPDDNEIVQIWGEDSQTVLHELRVTSDGKSSDATIARTSPCGNYILTGDMYGSKAAILRRSSGEVVATTPASRGRLLDVAYAPNGKTIALAYENGVVECFRVWRHRNGTITIHERPIVTRPHHGPVNSLKFVSAEKVATCGADGVVKLWRHNLDAQEFHWLGPPMLGLQYSPDGSLLAYVHRDGCGIFDVDNKYKQISDVRLPADLQGGLAWSPSGAELAICVESKDGNSIQFLNRQGQRTRTFPHGGDLDAIAYSPDGQLLAAIGDPQLQILRTDDGQVVHRRALTATGKAVAFSHDGDLLAYSVHPDSVFLMSTADFQPKVELRSFGGADCIAFSSDDSVLVIGRRDGVIQLWDVGTGLMRTELVGHELAVRDVAFSPDDRTLLSAALDGTVRLWSVEHGQGFGAFFRDEGSCRLSLSSDGRRLAVGNYRRHGRDVHVWNGRFSGTINESTAF